MTENGVILSSASAERPMATKQFNVFNLYWLLLCEQYISPTSLHSFVSVLSAAIVGNRHRQNVLEAR